ncbi:hypothetical protein CIB48_g272 [Xylaria polymorpha]|nr:hypothetical protein CIB48_g272 [Xylaria polymorpha]
MAKPFRFEPLRIFARDHDVTHPQECLISGQDRADIEASNSVAVLDDSDESSSDDNEDEVGNSTSDSENDSGIDGD